MWSGPKCHPTFLAVSPPDSGLATAAAWHCRKSKRSGFGGRPKCQASPIWFWGSHHDSQWSVVNIPRISKRNIMSKSTNQLTKWSNVNQNQLSYINYHKQSLITLITLITTHTNHPCCQVDASTPLSHVETKPPQFVVPPGTQNVGRTWKSIHLWNIVNSIL